MEVSKPRKKKATTIRSGGGSIAGGVFRNWSGGQRRHDVIERWWIRSTGLLCLSNRPIKEMHRKQMLIEIMLRYSRAQYVQ